jgi:hypothetical protein
VLFQGVLLATLLIAWHESSPFLATQFFLLRLRLSDLSSSREHKAALLREMHSWTSAMQAADQLSPALDLQIARHLHTTARYLQGQDPLLLRVYGSLLANLQMDPFRGSLQERIFLELVRLSALLHTD